MNNCGVRTVLSTVLGAGMGVMFGIFMGTMDTVRPAGGSKGGSCWFPMLPLKAHQGRVLRRWLLLHCLAAARCTPAAATFRPCRPAAGCLCEAVPLTLHAVPQGAVMGGALPEYQNQTMKQAFKDMLKNTASKSRCAWQDGDRTQCCMEWQQLLGFDVRAAGGSAASSSCCGWTLDDPTTFTHLHPPTHPPRSYAKGFAAMGALFAGSECLIESYRGRHDSLNSVYAGCTTGAILGYSGGPKAMCIGCASFAAFSVVIDR